MKIAFSFFSPFNNEQIIEFPEGLKEYGDTCVWYTKPGEMNEKSGKYVLTFFFNNEYEPRLTFNTDDGKQFIGMNVSVIQ